MAITLTFYLHDLPISMYYFGMTEDTKQPRIPRTAREARSLADSALKDWEGKWDSAMHEALQKQAERTAAGYYVIQLEESHSRNLQHLAAISSKDIEAFAAELLVEAIDRLLAETEDAA